MNQFNNKYNNNNNNKKYNNNNNNNNNEIQAIKIFILQNESHGNK